MNQLENKENQHLGNHNPFETIMNIEKSNSSNMSCQDVISSICKLSFDFDQQPDKKFHIDHSAVDRAHKKPAIFLKKFEKEEPYFDSV